MKENCRGCLNWYQDTKWLKHDKNQPFSVKFNFQITHTEACVCCVCVMIELNKSKSLRFMFVSVWRVSVSIKVPLTWLRVSSTANGWTALHPHSPESITCEDILSTVQKGIHKLRLLFLHQNSCFGLRSEATYTSCRQTHTHIRQHCCC